MSKSSTLKVTDINVKQDAGTPVDPAVIASLKALVIEEALKNATPPLPPEAAAEPMPAPTDSPRIAELKAKLAAAQLNAHRAKEYAIAHPVKTAGIVTTVALAVFGGYKLVREITG